MPKYLDETGLAHYHGNVGKRPVQTFDTVAAMQAADWLKAGMTCHTNGFHASGDGGAAYYTVSASGTANGMDVLALQGGLYATLVVTGTVNPYMLGAHGNSTDDDYASLQRMVNTYPDCELKAGVYRISQTLHIKKPIKLVGCGADSAIYGADTVIDRLILVAYTSIVNHDMSLRLQDFAVLPYDADLSSSGLLATGMHDAYGIELMVNPSGSTPYYYHQNSVISGLLISQFGRAGVFYNCVSFGSGFFGCVLEKCNIHSGIKTYRFGDGNSIRDNIIQYAGEVYVDGINGETANSELRHNVITCDGGVHIGRGCLNFLVENNQIELVGKTSLEYGIKVEQRTTKIIGNNVNVAGSDVPCILVDVPGGCIYVSNNTLICGGAQSSYPNTYAIATSDGASCVIAVAVKNLCLYGSTIITSSSYFSINDNSILTGLVKTYTIDNGTDLSGTFYSIFNADGTVSITGTLTATSAISNQTAIRCIPSFVGTDQTTRTWGVGVKRYSGKAFSVYAEYYHIVLTELGGVGVNQGDVLTVNVIGEYKLDW